MLQRESQPHLTSNTLFQTYQCFRSETFKPWSVRPLVFILPWNCISGFHNFYNCLVFFVHFHLFTQIQIWTRAQLHVLMKVVVGTPVLRGKLHLKCLSWKSFCCSCYCSCYNLEQRIKILFVSCYYAGKGAWYTLHSGCCLWCDLFCIFWKMSCCLDFCRRVLFLKFINPKVTCRYHAFFVD